MTTTAPKIAVDRLRSAAMLRQSNKPQLPHRCEHIFAKMGVPGRGTNMSPPPAQNYLIVVASATLLGDGKAEAADRMGLDLEFETG
ncbi:hypothetical protein, partial [Mesorhizobium humile]|uniref:hypothetical protein n=1 Tax=Mesorhizobium humile TaxID=3072313 RepID=UPI002A249F3E